MCSNDVLVSMFFIVKNTFAERNKTFCDKTLNKCIANAYFFPYFVTLIN